MARLIDYHTNCHCGGDVHTTAHLDEEGRLSVLTQAQGQAGVGQDADAGLFLGNAMAEAGLVAAVLPDGTLRTDDHPATDSLDRTDDTLERLAKLVEASAWLAEQLDAGTLDVDEARRRFGISAADQAETPPEADEAAVATPGPQRGRPRRAGGGG